MSPFFRRAITLSVSLEARFGQELRMEGFPHVEAPHNLARHCLDIATLQRMKDMIMFI